jgi:hypothetical protein
VPTKTKLGPTSGTCGCPPFAIQPSEDESLDEEASRLRLPSGALSFRKASKTNTNQFKHKQQRIQTQFTNTTDKSRRQQGQRQLPRINGFLCAFFPFFFSGDVAGVGPGVGAVGADGAPVGLAPCVRSLAYSAS